MRAIEGYTGHAITLFGLRLAAHLFVRPDRSVWNIPAEKIKMRRAHRVPLSKQVVGMFEELWDLPAPNATVSSALDRL